LKLDFSNEFSKIYNINVDVVLNELKKILRKELNKENIFFRKNNLYESYINENDIYVEKKIRLTTKYINKIIEELKNRLIEISLKNERENIYNKFEDRLVNGEIIAKNDYAYIIEIENCKFKGILYKNKQYSHYNWDLEDKGLFYISKIIIKDNELFVLLNDYNTNIEKYRIINLCSGIYIKKIKFQKDKIFINSIPKLDNNIKKQIELLFNKKVIIKKNKKKRS
jgi:hypothetical protein